MPTVGSSRTSRSGSLTSATAKRSRWVSPPLSRSVLRSASSSSFASLQGLVHAERLREQGGHHRDELADGQVAQDAAGLEHRADAAGLHRALGRPAEDSDSALVGLLQAEQHVHGRRLACAVRAEERDGLSRLDRDVDSADGVDRPFGRAVGLLQAVQLDAVSVTGIRRHRSTVPTVAGSRSHEGRRGSVPRSFRTRRGSSAWGGQSTGTSWRPTSRFARCSSVIRNRIPSDSSPR